MESAIFGLHQQNERERFALKFAETFQAVAWKQASSLACEN
jgi:hypothetical protein